MIAIHSLGEGRDLVFLPGWGMHRAMWGELPGLLARHARVHVCELPGCGGNEREMHAFDALVDALAQASAEKIDVLGWSLGGMLAQAWAVAYPDQVNRLVLLGSTPSFITRPEWTAGTPPGTLKNFMAAAEKNRDDLMQSFLGGMSRGEADSEAAVMQMRRLYAQAPAATVASLRRGLEWLRDLDLRESLPRIKQPVLLLHGEEDAITPVEASRRMAEVLDNARLGTIAECGHAPHLSRPMATYESIRNFLHD